VDLLLHHHLLGDLVVRRLHHHLLVLYPRVLPVVTRYTVLRRLWSSTRV
jgi:hypothetical protein